MRQELTDVLYKLAPNLYGDHSKSMRETAMCWGFACGDGWFNLLLEASIELEKLGIPELRAVQVKEKFGTLRFYVNLHNEEIDKIIHRAGRRSSIECEVCGAAAKATGGGWIRTECAKHNPEDDCNDEEDEEKKPEAPKENQ